METTEARLRKGGHARRRLVLLGWLIVGVFYFLPVSGYISASMKDRTFNDYVGYVVDLALMEHRPATEIRSLLLVKADELSIPLQGEQIRVDPEGRSLRVVVDYETDIRIPFFNRTVYRKKFTHDVTRTN